MFISFICEAFCWRFWNLKGFEVKFVEIESCLVNFGRVLGIRIWVFFFVFGWEVVFDEGLFCIMGYLGEIRLKCIGSYRVCWVCCLDFLGLGFLFIFGLVGCWSLVIEFFLGIIFSYRSCFVWDYGFRGAILFRFF